MVVSPFQRPLFYLLDEGNVGEILGKRGESSNPLLLRKTGRSEKEIEFRDFIQPPASKIN